MPRHRASSVQLREAFYRLQSLTGMTKKAMHEKSGLPLSSLDRIERNDWVTSTVAKVFLAMLPEHEPAAVEERGLPADIEAQRQQYQWFEGRRDAALFKHFVDTLEPLLEAHESLRQETGTTEEQLRAVGVIWLLAWISHDRTFYLQEGESHWQQAMSRWDAAVARLKLLVAAIACYAPLLDKLKLGRFVTYFDGQPKASRSTNPDVAQWIRDNDMLVVCRACAVRQPYGWSAIRNGLVIASILERADECREFYRLLLIADRHFADWTYQPTDSTPPLATDPDLDFFRSALRPPAQCSNTSMRNGNQP